MKKNIRIISLILFIVVFSTFVACGPTENNNIIINNNNNTDNNENTADTDNTDNAIDDYKLDGIDYDADPIHIEYMGMGTNAIELDDHLFTTLHLNQKFNIDLTYSSIASIDKENIDLLIAAQSLPDCGWLYSGVPVGTAAKYYLNNVIRSFPIDYVQQYAPFTYEMLKAKAINMTMHLVPDDNTKIFCVFANRYKFDTVGWTLALRYDWMKNLNIDPKGDFEEAMPDTGIYLQKDAYTIDEFTDIIYQFTYSDPDMNGENDTMGYDTCKPNISDHGYMATVMSAYGFNRYYVDDGSGWCVPGNYSPQAKLAYAKVQEWIDLGVTFQDLYNTNWAEFWAIWNSGKAGSADTKLGWLNLEEKTDNLFSIQLFVPESELICGPGLIDNDGTGGKTEAYEQNEFTETAGFFYISSTVTDDEKLKRILMLFDYMCIDPVGATKCNYGIEGINYTLNKQNDIIITDQEILPSEQRVFAAYGTPGINIMNSPANPDGKKIKNIIYKYSIENWPLCFTSDLIAPSAFEINTDIEWFDRNNKQARAQAQTDFLKIVFMADGDLDVAWDNLMNIFNETGYEGYLVELNTHGKLKANYDNGEIVHPIDLYPTHGE